MLETLTTNKSPQLQRFWRGYGALDFRVSVIGPAGKALSRIGEAAPSPFIDGSIKPVTLKPRERFRQAFSISEHFRFETLGTYQITVARYCGPAVSSQRSQIRKDADVFTADAKLEIQIVKNRNPEKADQK